MLDRLHILLVDEDPSEAEMYTVALTKLGGAVTTAASVEEALARIANEPCDVVVTDVMLAGRDGYDLARELRAVGSSLPALALTGFSGPAERVKAREAGFDAFREKPLLPTELAELIVEVTARTQGTRMPPDLGDGHAL